nr:MAG: glycoprotein precursor [Drosophila Tranent phlebovirus]
MNLLKICLTFYITINMLKIVMGGDIFANFVVKVDIYNNSVNMPIYWDAKPVLDLFGNMTGISSHLEQLPNSHNRTIPHDKIEQFNQWVDFNDDLKVTPGTSMIFSNSPLLHSTPPSIEMSKVRNTFKPSRYSHRNMVLNEPITRTINNPSKSELDDTKEEISRDGLGRSMESELRIFQASSGKIAEGALLAHPEDINKFYPNLTNDKPENNKRVPTERDCNICIQKWLAEDARRQNLDTDGEIIRRGSRSIHLGINCTRLTGVVVPIFNQLIRKKRAATNEILKINDEIEILNDSDPNVLTNEKLEEDKCNGNEANIEKWSNGNCNKVIDLFYNPNTGLLCSASASCTNPRSILIGKRCRKVKVTDGLNSVCSNDVIQESTDSGHIDNFINLKENDICSIGSHIINDCTKFKTRIIRRIVSTCTIDSTDYLVTKEHSFKFSPNLKNIQNYICKGCLSSIDCTKCSGDASYQFYFKPNDTLPCFCQLNTNKQFFGDLKLMVDNLEITIHKRISKELELTIKNGNKEEDVSHICFGCHSSCENGMIKLTGFSGMTAYVKICSKVGCYSAVYDHFINLPLQISLQAKEIEITTYLQDGSFSIIQNATCVTTELCDLIHCTLCLEHLMNPKCYTLVDKIAFSLTLIVSCLILTLFLKLLQLVIVVIKLFGVLWKICRFIVKVLYKLYLRIKGKTIIKGRQVYSIINDNDKNPNMKQEIIYEKKMDIIVDINEDLPSSKQRNIAYWKNKAYKQSTSSQLMLLIVVFLFIPSILCCSNLASLSLEERDCNVVQGVKTCDITFKTVLTVPGFGGDSCLSLKSIDNQHVGSLHLKLSSIKTRCRSKFLYYTFDAVIGSRVECHCWLSSTCNDEVCGKYNGLSKIDGMEMEPLKNAGIGTCQRMDSTWSSHCHVPLSGCCYGQSWLYAKSREDIFKVEMCDSYYWQAAVDAKLNFQGISTSFKVELSPGIKTDTRIGPLTLISVSQPATMSLDQCILTNVENNTHHVVGCSREDELVKGKIGEIRCQAEPLPTSKGCTIAKGLLNLLDTDFNYKASLDSLKIKDIVKNRVLPLNRPGYYANFDGKGYYFKTTTNSAFSIQIELKNTKIRINSEVTSCQMEFVSLSGCYQCDESAILTVKSACSSYPQIGILNCEYEIVDLPFVIEEPKDLKIQYSSNSPIVNAKCNATLGKSFLEFPISGSLNYIPKTSIVLNQIDLINKGNSTKSIWDVSWPEVGSFFSNLFSSWKFWAFHVGIVTIILGIIGLKVYLRVSSPKMHTY